MLHWDNSRGNTKKANLKNLERFCEWKKEGQKFVITNVFDNPKKRLDKRSDGNNMIYVKLIETILLDYFIQQDQCSLDFTKKQLWEALGMINQQFLKNDGNPSFVTELQEIDDRVRQWHIDKAYDSSRKKLNDITKAALKSLQRRKLIEYRDNVLVAHEGKEYFEVTRNYQIERVLQCEKEALNDLGCKNLREVIYNSNPDISLEKYYEIRNCKLKERIGFDFVFRRYSIVCNRKFLDQGIEENIVELNKKLLNGKIIDSLDKQALKDYARNREAFQKGETKFRYPDYYVNIQRLIFKQILNIDDQSVDEFATTLDIEAEIDAVFPALAS